MTSHGTPGWLVTVGVFALGLGAGSLLASLISRPTAQPLKPASPGSDLPVASLAVESGTQNSDLAHALRDLSVVLSSLEHTLATNSANTHVAAPTTRTDASPSAAMDPVLVQSFQQIANSLQRLSAQNSAGGSVATTSSLVAPTYVDRKSAFGFFDVAPLVRDVDGAYDNAMSDLKARHLFWSQQDILTRYGKPDYIEAEGDVISWSYQDVGVVDGLGKGAIDFYFHHGTVYTCDINWEEF